MRGLEEDEQSSAIDKGRNFMGFEPISIDEVFTDLIFLYLLMEQRDKAASHTH